MFYIYILYSITYNRYYVGHTNDVERRLKEHNSNPRMTYTHKFRPWEIMASFKVNQNRGDAIKLERYIKKQKSRKVIERLIQEPGFFLEIAQLHSGTFKITSPKLRIDYLFSLKILSV